MKHMFCNICKCNECTKNCNCGICYEDDSRMRISCNRIEYKEENNVNAENNSEGESKK